MKEVFRIKLEALNMDQIIHTYYSDYFDCYPTNENIKSFMESHKSVFKTRCQCQVIKFYILDN